MRQTQPTASDRGAQSSERPASASPSPISRFLAREKRLRLVVNELGHRAKNMLAVVQSIATQTAQHSDDLDTFRSAFSQRLGALSVPEGGVSVSWGLARGDSGSERFRLIWREHNGPPVTPPDHHGFGSMILQRIAVAMLGGNVQHDFDVGGVAWTLETPAAAILLVKPETIVGVSDR